MELDRELELMRVNEASFQQRYKKITLDDTDDTIDRSTIIPVDYNYELDMLGDAAGSGMSFMFDLNEKNLLETTAMPPPKRPPSLGQTKSVNERTPFRDLTNNANSVQREAQPSRESPFDDTTLMQEGQTETRKETTGNESAFERLLTDDFNNMPNLFQDTLVQQETLMQQEPLEQRTEQLEAEQQQQQLPPHEFREDIENVQFPDGPQRPLPKSISVELKDLRNNMSRKNIARETAKERAIAKKGRLIVDTVTEISTNELKKRLVPAFETEQEMLTYFRERNTWLKTLNDYELQDTQLFTAPFTQDARRIDFPMRDYDLFKRNSKRNQLVIKSKLLRTVRSRDDTYSYLTEARDRKARAAAHEEQTVLETAQPVLEQVETVQKEVQRKGKSLSREVQESNELAMTRARNRSSARGSYINDLGGNQVDTPSVDQTMDMPASDMTLLPMAPLDLLADQTTIQPPQMTTAEETTVAPNIPINQPDSDDYEKFILDALSASSADGVILQDLIRDSILSSRCLQAQMPRKYFAAKIIFTSLKMCGQRQIQLNQKAHYDYIYITEN